MKAFVQGKVAAADSYPGLKTFNPGPFQFSLLVLSLLSLMRNQPSRSFGVELITLSSTHHSMLLVLKKHNPNIKVFIFQRQNWNFEDHNIKLSNQGYRKN